MVEPADLPADLPVEAPAAGSDQPVPSPTSVTSLWFTPGVDPRIRQMFLPHTLRVLTLVTYLADRCQAYGSSLELGVLAHDLGMAGVSPGILLKPDRLELLEAGLLRAHVHSGAWICRELVGDPEAAEVVLHHHERWDGSGYPAGLAGEEIPVGARVLAVPDVFDTLTFEQRPYQERLFSLEEALEEVEAAAGSLFEPRVVEAFLRMVEEEPGLTDPERLEDQARGELEARGVPLSG